MITPPPAAPSIPGLIFRCFRGESDYAGILEVGNVSRAADHFFWVNRLEDIEREYTHLVNSDPAQDMIIAEVDGHMIGYVHGSWTFVEDDGGVYRHHFMPMLVPQWRGQGIRRYLIRWIAHRMAEVAREHPTGSVSALNTFAPEKAAELAAVLLDEGFAVVRYFDTMVRPLTGTLPDFPMPPGIELRPVQPEHYRAIWDAAIEAFKGHYDYFVPDEVEYEAWQAHETHFNPALWQIAWDTATDEVAGQIRTFIDAGENQQFDRRRGYTEFISVGRPYRRLGLARALIAESLRVQRAEGMDESALMVDADNTSGASRLYTDCGFTLERRTVAYEKSL